MFGAPLRDKGIEIEWFRGPAAFALDERRAKDFQLALAFLTYRFAPGIHRTSFEP